MKEIDTVEGRKVRGKGMRRRIAVKAVIRDRYSRGKGMRRRIAVKAVIRDRYSGGEEGEREGHEKENRSKARGLREDKGRTKMDA